MRIQVIIMVLTAGLVIWAAPAAHGHLETKIVEMTAEGFEPEEVTIDQGGIIHFVNRDTADRWPASNVHPTHEIYADFDPKQPIVPGEDWFFRAERPGSWQYHDHLFPHKRGRLIVEAETGNAADEYSASDQTARSPDPAEKKLGLAAKAKLAFTRLLQSITSLFRQFSRATEAPSDFTSLAEADQYEFLRRYNDQHGLKKTWELVRSQYTNRAGSSLGGQAHDIAHFVGSLMYEEKGMAGLSLCDPTFAFGCYHGFTESAFSKDLSLLPVIESACREIGAVKSGPWASCVHGIGHGVATFYHSTKIDQALASCDELANGATYCHDGVFMEFSFSAPPSFYQSDDPLFPCTAVGPSYQAACGRNQPQVMAQRLKMPANEIIDHCTKAPKPIGDTCTDAVGFAIANESGGSPEAIVAGCAIFPNTTQQAQCTAAAAGELVFQNYQGWQVSAPAACDGLPIEFRQDCYQRVRQTAQNYQR
jgi:plastocyanin